MISYYLRQKTHFMSVLAFLHTKRFQWCECLKVGQWNRINLEISYLTGKFVEDSWNFNNFGYLYFIASCYNFMDNLFKINYRNFILAYSFTCLENNSFLVKHSFIVVKIIDYWVSNYFKVEIIINFEGFKIKKGKISA